MKKINSKMLIIIGLFVVLIIVSLIVMFILNLKEDKKITQDNINTINISYDNIKNEVVNYNNLRNDIANFINDFYYETIEEEYSNNLTLLNNYDEIINKITNEVNILDSKCNITYSDSEVTNICNNYKTDYETIVNVFINDINSYNIKLESFNTDRNKQLILFKSNYINDYIDYNNDNIYAEKVVTNE